MMANRKYSFIQLSDLPDEILIHIFKNLYNFEVLDSLIDVNDQFNAIAHDSMFTSRLTLMRRFSDDFIYPLSDSMLDRFCLQILPSIHYKIKWLNLESSSMKRILRTINYPNLYGLGLYYTDIERARSFINDQSSLININKNQITSFVIDVTEKKKRGSVKDVNLFIFQHIFTIFPNLQYLNFNPSLIDYQQISFDISPLTFISSNLLELHISLTNFIDCLDILDGRFNQLRTFKVKICQFYFSRPIIDNKKKLPTLKCFSLNYYTMIDCYDELILPLLHRMFNLEKLDLILILSVKTTFIDGNELKENIINSMPYLNKFTFNIRSKLHFDKNMNLRSNKDIQNTFNDFKNNHIISCIDYFKEKKSSQCHIYSYPYKLEFYDNITNNFPGGLFKCVRAITLYDEHPFEHEFFIRISQSFPFVKEITLRNYKPQNNKLYKQSNKDNQGVSIIKYPHLTTLIFHHAHHHYIEQFLVDTKTCLPNNVYLDVNYRRLKIVTHNFTRESTRINCAKISSLYLTGDDQFSKYFKNYFPHTKIF